MLAFTIRAGHPQDAWEESCDMESEVMIIIIYQDH